MQKRKIDMGANNQNLENKSNGIPKQKKSYLIAKRVMDVLCALGASIVLSPLLLGIAAAVKIDSKGPIIFKHRRVGKNGETLYLYKFRTMFDNAEAMMKDFTPEQKAEFARNFKLKDDPRITKVGKFLRKTSLDELPQLLNILQGNLSVVGPRPVTQREVELYGDQQAKFLSVTPGLTGYWQAYVRSCSTYEQRIQMELYYVDHANFWWDLKIILVTFGAVFSGRGAM